MCAKLTCIVYIIIITACSPGKGGNSFLSRQQADSLVHQYSTQKNYAAVDSVARLYINGQIKENKLTDTFRFAESIYDTLSGDPLTRKDFAQYLYRQASLLSEDTLVRNKLYNFFCWNYAYDYHIDNYDPVYIGIAEYFINQQRLYPWLNKDRLLDFKESLGIAYNVAGDTKKAISYYKETNEYDIRNNDFDKAAGSTLNTCTALLQQGYADSVIGLIRRATDTPVANWSRLAGLYTSMAEAYTVLGNFKGAAEAIEKGFSCVRGIQDTDKLSERLSDLYKCRSVFEYKQGLFKQSATSAHQAIAQGIISNGTFHNRYIGKLLLQLGACFRQLNQPDSALWYFHQALYTVAPVDSANLFSLPEEKNIYAENTMMDALDSLALTWDEQYTKTKNSSYLEKALQARKLAFIVETKLLEAFTYDESMKSQLLQDKKRSEYALNNCYRLWQQDQHPKWIAQALLMNEQSKAVALLHSLKKNSALNSLQQQDSTAILLNRNRLQTLTLEKELNNTTGSEEKTALQNRLNELYREGLLLENELKARLPGFKRTGVDTSSLSLEAIRKNLVNRQSCLLQYFAAGTGAYLVWVDGAGTQGMQWIPGNSLPAVDSFITVCRQPHGLYENDRQAFFSLAKLATYTVLPETIQQHIKNGNYKKLLVIPDGNFSLLPFDALTPSDEQFLVRYATVYTGYSISTLLANDTPKEQAKDISVFIPFNRSNIGELTRLEFSQEEANAVLAARKTAQVYGDTAAGINRFRNVLGTSRIIHLATHAMGSSTRQVIFFNDDALDVSELYALHTHAELVVLNGCETGAGLIDPNEGPMSLARGFYYAGARNVINSLWQIDDLATASMFGNFYKDYATGKTGPALRNAKLGYLDTHSGKELAPYYWAGLVQTGMDMEPVKNKQWKRWLPAGFILIALLIFGLAAYKRRRH